MTAPQAKPQRCAVYTRVSTDAGLEQDFNSLDAQREACEAYIKSQTHEGWRPIKGRFDDGGFSGGSLERPALQALLAAIRERRLDIIVVYKVDRLTRSLADFAKLVELFDGHCVSFVSVTQSFNTTTSMVRLTLNVLLSFAQFEREVTGERIRDKIGASKRKGLWMGGVVPLGYQVEHRKLQVVPDEADTVRLIFERYRDLRSLVGLQRDLRERGLATRVRTLVTGRSIGGIEFMNGALQSILHNRTYPGEINHRGNSYPGEHAPIVDVALFDAVQAILDANRRGRREHWRSSNALLAGKLEDDRGNRMSPSNAIKTGVRYRYYVSRALLEGRKEEAGAVARVAANDIEELVAGALRTRGLIGVDPAELREAVQTSIDRVTLTPKEIVIALAHGDDPTATVIRLAWTPPDHRRRRSLAAPFGHPADAPGQRSMRAEARARMLIAIANAREWLDQLLRGTIADPAAIAKREQRSERSVRMTLTLAFLAPDIISGTLPRGIGLTALADLPIAWTEQRQRMGLAAKGSEAK